ncbi:efflux RND transporter periplasmic adaptor subunit [Caulifigura coniformis]|uniref:efflux RND transporter periplasmic adaptor subunit n=1 Tax=Caulifigura coniformis TaxID=2527983 RepID=UPI0018D203F7|nr:efflux RND transporter periplasmic adaptor subunit [Caulifigura coniformis]
MTVRHPELRQVVDSKDYNGTAAASATVEIRSRVRGYIQDVHFVDGQNVKAGELLFELDPRPFQLEIDAARQQLALDQAQLEASQLDEQRQKDLMAKMAGTRADLEKAVATRKSWEAKIQIAQELIRQKELDLEYSRITAPISGQLSRAQLTKGNLVNAGGSDPLLTTLVAIDPIYLYFNVDERTLLEYRAHRASKEKAGQLPPVNEAGIPFEFGLETETGFPNKGVIDFAENTIEASTGTLQIRGRAENADRRYVPGSRVRIRIATGDPYEAVCVPEISILSDQDKKYVLTLNAEKVVVRRDVLLGTLLDDGMQVIRTPPDSKTPLTPDDLVITVGLQRARINYPVQPMNEQGEALALAK